MRKTMKKVFLLLPVLCCMLACESEPIEPQPIDYRLQYVGDYEFTIDYWSYSAGAYPDPMYRDTTWYYSGTVSLVDDSLKNRVLVYWGDDELPGYMIPPLISQSSNCQQQIINLIYPPSVYFWSQKYPNFEYFPDCPLELKRCCNKQICSNCNHDILHEVCP